MKSQHDVKNHDVQTRSIARQLARELSQEELDTVSGGTWSGTGEAGITDDADILNP